MRRLFVDTSAWFAYVNRRDPDHPPVRDMLQAFRGRLVTSNLVFDETVTFCLRRLGHSRAVRVGETLSDSTVVDLVRITPQDERAAWTLFTERADKTYSFTDCTSFVIMRRLGVSEALALDADFQREGFRLFPEA